MKQILIAVSITAACSGLAYAQTATVPPDQSQSGQDQGLTQRIKQLEDWRNQQVNSTPSQKQEAVPAQNGIASIPVTVYGLADFYLENGYNGVNNIQRLQSGGLSGSRVGFKGNDVVCKGVDAFYNLEAGLNINNGTSGQGAVLFGRQAYAGLEGKKWGALSVGRQYAPVFLANVIFMGGGLYGGMAYGNASDNFFDASIARINNSINYVTPKILGFTLDAFYGLGETSQTKGQINVGNVFSYSVQYDLGAFSAIASSLTRQTTPTVSGTWKVASATYDFKVVKIAVMYQTQKDLSEPENNYFDEISAYVPLGQGGLLIDYGTLHNKLMVNADAKFECLRYEYFWTKRTTIYTGIGNMINEANANFGIFGSTGAPLTIVKGNNERSIILGAKILF